MDLGASLRYEPACRQAGQAGRFDLHHESSLMHFHLNKKTLHLKIK
jgi:hypothetical protein